MANFILRLTPMKIKLLIAFVMVAQFSIAQSLVLNYDLEGHSQCPQALFNILDADNCTEPTEGSPDYFHRCSTGGFVGVPFNVFGVEDAHSDSAYVGFWALIDTLRQDPYREYVQMELSSPLEVGKEYCVKFYVSPGDRFLLASNGIGLLFRMGASFNILNTDMVQQTPDIAENAVIDDTTGWTQVSGTFTADSAYTHLIIGNFYDNNTVQFAFTGQYPQGFEDIYGAYYYLDDVTIEECPDSTVNPLPIVIPNVFTPSKADGLNDAFVIQDLPPNSNLIIYNRWGTVVYQSNNYQNDWTGDNHSDSVYYYILTTAAGKMYKGTITKL
jgi:OOP family OmpA-OmpF porin